MTYLMVATTAAVYAILATDSDKEVGREEKGGERRGVRQRKEERGEKTNNLPCSGLGNTCRLGEERKEWEVGKEGGKKEE